MARTVTDAAIMLGALEEPVARIRTIRRPRRARRRRNRDYTAFLKPDGLKGARIGIPRAFYYDATKAPGRDRERGGLGKRRARRSWPRRSRC